jgi:transcriptional regulator with XRE-family HTH domain
VPSFDENARGQLKKLGEFIRERRQTAELSLRDLAARTNVSNPYLSQVERGLHEPSVRVLKAIATALNMSAETLLVQAGILGKDEVEGSNGSGGDADGTRAPTRLSTEDAIAGDERLSPDQRGALLAVYRSYVETNDRAEDAKKPTRRSRPGSP